MIASIEDISETGEHILLKDVTEFSSNWLLLRRCHAENGADRVEWGLVLFFED